MLASIEDRVETLITNKINELGYELYDIEYAKEGKEYYLRVFIDKPEGIDLNDCEKVSDGINELLDKADYIKAQYFLEVSSPGIERILRKDKHFKDNIGSIVEVKLFKSINKDKSVVGNIKEFNEKCITLENENGEIQIERKNIAQVKTVYEW